MSLALHEFHEGLHANFTTVNGAEAVNDYGDYLAEYNALHDSVGILDLSFRSRICLTGADRNKFLNGQVTNDVVKLKNGEGCYAMVITAKGKAQSDLNIYNLESELLLDCEPGQNEAITQRLDKYIIADDVQIVDVAPHYGLLSIQGPKAADAIAKLDLGFYVPTAAMNFSTVKNEMLGELYLMNQSRTVRGGFDLFVPTNAMAAVADKLIAAAKELGGRACGWQALETTRVEAALPRFGVDIDETNLPPETGTEKRSISYTKGCYIGQEVIARIRTYGQVAKALRGLRLAQDLPQLPGRGDKLFLNDKEVGYITSAVHSPKLQADIALGYVRREANKIGTELTFKTSNTSFAVQIVEVPFMH